MSFEALIKYSCWFFCENCDYKYKSKNGLRIPAAKMSDWGNTRVCIKCTCGWKQENIGQSNSEREKHNITDHKKVVDDGFIKWNRGFTKENKTCYFKWHNYCYFVI